MDRRTKILAAAERLISHYGIGKTTVGDIATEAKIGVGSVYLEFGSKDEIVATLTQSHQSELDYVEILDGQPMPKTLKKFLERRLVRFSYLSQKPHGLDLIDRTCSDVDSVCRDFAARENENLQDFLRRAGHDDPAGYAAVILELHDHFERLSCGSKSTPQNFKRFVTLIVSGVFAPPRDI